MTRAARKTDDRNANDQEWALERAPFIDAAETLASRIAEAVVSGNANECAGCYTEDAVILAPNQVAVTGQDEIRKHFEKAISRRTMIASVLTLRAEADGRIGYLIQSVGATTGSFTVVRMMRLTEDGVWRICAETVAA
jgi:ketosteroid isomerase-like protein